MVILKTKDNINHDKLSIYTKHLPKNYNFELIKIINTIKNGKHRRIALQMPDGLLKYSLIITDTIKAMITEYDVDIILLGDVVYGACCIDDKSAYSLSCDLLIHFGHSCLVPLNVCKIKCLYVFVDILFDIEHAIKMIRKVALENVLTQKLLKNENKNSDKYSESNIIDSENSDKKENSLEVKNQTKDTEIYNLMKEISLCGTIQFNTAINIISKQLKISSPQIKPLSKGELLGCTSPIIKNKKIVIYISDGRFHLESVMIQNPLLKYYKYCPFMKKMTREMYDYKKMIDIRKESKKMFENECKSVGVILGDLGRQGNPKIFKNIMNYLQDKKYKVYKIVLKEINEESLDQFSFCEGFIQVSCPRLSIDWGVNYKKPLLNPYELFSNIDDYKMDYYSKEESKQWNNY